MISTISNSLVILGALILVASLFTVRIIIRRLPTGHARTSWFAMAGMITFFVLGYLGYIGIFWNRHLTLLDLVVPGVFFFGACFVWLSGILALQTAIDVMRIADLEMEAFTDPLTGVYNRRFMQHYLREEVAKARRYGFELAVMLLDIDHFKLINDDHGHQAGDQVLIEITGIISQELRDSDIVARYGGEEFIIIAPNTNLANAEVFANRMLKRIATHNFRLNPKEAHIHEIHLTVSIGLANLGGLNINEESLIYAADKNLYRAKDEGRNRVVAGDVKI